MFNKKNEIKEEAKFEELEVAEEFCDGWFAAGVATGVAIGLGVIVLT
ncbi:MAG: hypothetical protein IKL04_02265 [Lachnospiraceae bacterium]|nr:hypothetical protein [Lachnospiraceae bacterium]